MAFHFIGDLWNQWNVRVFVILSLFLQIFLILFASLRKKIANDPIFFLLWLFYLMADWIAAFTNGLISHNQGNSYAHVANIDEALPSILGLISLGTSWRSYHHCLLFGGQFTWRRHLLSLIFQLFAAIYVFMRIFPTDKSLVIPTMLVFLSGVIKNVERTMALNFSSFPRLRKWVLSQPKFSFDAHNNELVKPLDDLRNAYSNEKELAESIAVKHAYYLQMFTVFVTNHIFTGEKRKKSLKYFREVSAMDALRVISVDLNYLYKMLYTKRWQYVPSGVTFSAL